MKYPAQLKLTNGWTLSIAHDLSGVGYSVAAFPTGEKRTADERWFKFQEGGCLDRRIFDIEELMSLMREVAAASPPAPLKSVA